jgi:integron integrase
MTKTDTKRKLEQYIRARNYSRETFKSYWRWISQYTDFCLQRRDLTHRDDRAREFLNQIAAQDAARATQKQALNALACLYNQLLGQEFHAGDFLRSKKPVRLPVCLSRPEIQTLLAALSGQTQLMAQLAYGAGLRLSDLIRLRIKDLDFDNRMIFIRDGKGAKDRTVPLPQSIAYPLQQQIHRASGLFQADRDAGAPAVHLPNQLGKKYPNAGKTFAWYWLWPAAKPSRDPDTGIVRRHHIHKNALQKAIARALPKTRIHKKVSVHTLRHSFATHMLQYERVDIHTLQRLMGHKHLSTTQVYLHCVPDLAGTTKSPLDSIQTIVEFPSSHSENPAEPSSASTG